MGGVKAPIAASFQAFDNYPTVEGLGAGAIGKDFAQDRYLAALLCEHVLHTVEHCRFKSLDVDFDETDAIEIEIVLTHISVEGNHLDSDLLRELASVLKEARG